MTRKRRLSPLSATLIVGLGLAGLVTFAFMSACNTFDSPYEDAERVSAVAGSSAPAAIADPAPVMQSLTLDCNTISLNSESLSYFESQTSPFPSCYYSDIQANWECTSKTQNYRVVNYHPDDAHRVERAVYPSQGTYWRYACHYRSGSCTTIKCSKFKN